MLVFSICEILEVININKLLSFGSSKIFKSELQILILGSKASQHS